MPEIDFSAFERWQTLIGAAMALLGGFFVLRGAKLQSQTDLIRFEREIDLRKKAFYTLAYLEFSEFCVDASILREELQTLLDSPSLNINLKREIALLSLPQSSEFIEEGFKSQIDLEPKVIEAIWEFHLYKKRLENFVHQLVSKISNDRRDSVPLLRPVMLDDDSHDLGDRFKLAIATLESAIDSAEKICLQLQSKVDVGHRLLTFR